MRDYAITLAAADPGFTPLSLYHNWKARRRIKEDFLNRGQHFYRDLGLNESDVRWAISLPLRHDPFKALEDCSNGKFQH